MDLKQYDGLDFQRKILNYLTILQENDHIMNRIIFFVALLSCGIQGRPQAYNIYIYIAICVGLYMFRGHDLPCTLF